MAVKMVYRTAGSREEARTVLRGVVAGTWEARFAEVVREAGRLLGSIEQEPNGGR